MYNRKVIKSVIIKVVFSASAQEKIQYPETGLSPSSFEKNAAIDQQIEEIQENNIRNYLINFCLRIFDHENSPVVNSSWSRVTRSGQPVALNLRANNLNIAVIFIPYFINEKSVMLLSQSKVILKYVNYSGGKYYSTVDSIPLNIGEKALFFPLGMMKEKVDNISSCVLEIEVLHYDITIEKGNEEQLFLESAPAKNVQNRNN